MSFLWSPTNASKLSHLLPSPNVKIPICQTDQSCIYSVSAETFNLRVGPNYNINKFKKPSKTELCDLLGIDVYSSPCKIPNVARYLKIPEMYTKDDPLIIINCQIPDYAPSNPLWGTGEVDGVGFNLINYFKFNPNDSAGSKLLSEFIERAPTDAQFAEKFKMIARIVNLEDTQFSSSVQSLVSTYNNTPFLTRPQHNFQTNRDKVDKGVYFLINIDVHIFAYMTLVGLSGILPYMNTTIVEYAFVVEAEEHELPERLLGAVGLEGLKSKADQVSFPLK